MAATHDVEGAGAYLVAAAALALVAGCVDAVVFGQVARVFPANQSGNAVLLGVGIGDVEAGPIWRPAVAILGFAIGVGGAVVLGTKMSHRRRAPVLIALELAFLTPLTIVLLTNADPADDLTDLALGVLLGLTACAMGLQTEVIRHVAGVSVATTYQSGAIARIGELAAQRRDTVALPSLGVLAVVLAAYIAGAALGAALGGWPGALLVPAGLLVVVVVALLVIRRPVGGS